MKIFKRSPFNYTGGKYPLLPQIFSYFPKSQIRNYIEYFAGGYNVGINVFARSYYLNEKDEYVSQFYSYLRDNYRYIDTEIKNIVNKWELTNDNAEKFYTFREYVNGIIRQVKESNKNLTNYPEEYHNLPVYIFILSCFAFNSMIRYNSNGEFNNTFGRRRYNKNIAKRLYEFGKELKEQNIAIDWHDFEYALTKEEFNNLNEDDFVYLDPPYLITQVNYCLNGAWTEDDEKRLYSFIEKLDKKGVKFALSNVLEHKGRKNYILINWLNEHNFNVYHLEKNYDKVQLLKGKTNTDEILITNYN